MSQFLTLNESSLVSQTVENLPAMQETWAQSLSQKIPWKREHQPTPVFLPGKSYRERSLAGCSPWGCKKSDTTDRLILGVYLKQDFLVANSEYSQSTKYTPFLLKLGSHQEGYQFSLSKIETLRKYVNSWAYTKQEKKEESNFLGGGLQ